MPLQWTVDYGNGAIPVELPHVWHLQVPVAWEGPAIYRATAKVEPETPILLFHGASYLAEVFVDGQPVADHRGIWDAFTVDLTPWANQQVEFEVRVTKNGGRRFPVRDVASGFIPYVFHTFGGLFRPVEFVGPGFQLQKDAAQTGVTVDNGRIHVHGKPFYARGILTWGWYPQTANPHADLATIRAEVGHIQNAGFNLVKFCLWLPPHHYLQELHRRGIWAWIELPIWLPNPEATSLHQMEEECLRIVSQYRHHPNILAWTAGCELSEGIDPQWRKGLVEKIQALTGHPLVKDNSGGAEMYGGHPDEFGTFEDFHPYCEPMDYPGVLASLAPGPRSAMPALLGEFNDYDLFRPLHQWVDDCPYWASGDPEQNDQGVRWQHDLPAIIANCRDSELGEWLERHGNELALNSHLQSVWMRQRAFDATRLQSWIDGWVLTGLRHTPISSAGILDDNGEPAYPVQTLRQWTADTSLLLFPRRTPPWVNGGNRAGFEPPTVRFAGNCRFLAAVHSVVDVESTLRWNIEGVGSGECPATRVRALETAEVGSFTAELPAGRHRLELSFGGALREFPIHVTTPLDPFDLGVTHRPSATLSRPFFREACLHYQHPAWAETGWLNDFERLALVASDQTIDPCCLPQDAEILLTRLDTRTFERLPIAARIGNRIVTTLLPGCPRGDQPPDPSKNPAAHDFLRLVERLLKSE